MEQLNSGDKLKLWTREEGWIPFQDAYLTEGTEYKLRYHGEFPNVTIHGIPIPFHPEKDSFTSIWMTPFQSGVLPFSIEHHLLETYIYPDDRKLTEAQYDRMIHDIMQEAAICFEYSGLDMQMDAFGKSRDTSWAQWSYIERNFMRLRQFYTRIEQQPIRQLERQPRMMRREQVQRVASDTLRWLDKKGYANTIPKNVLNIKTLETTNIYENQVLKQQLIDLHRLLKKYEVSEIIDISRKAKKYTSIITRWLHASFLTHVTENKGAYNITQRFRKHPVYRGWYLWFDKLYQHDHMAFGFDYPIPLKDTYLLYELWCYMMIVKALRELGYVEDTSNLFKTSKHGIFLDLEKNKKSSVQLRNNQELLYQRSYYYHSRDFYTYTQQMIPDIVIEGENQIIVFDPKYRIPTNLGTALGEMHKYRDGILHRETGKKAVTQVFILTPTKIEDEESLRYFRESFHQTHGMGAISLVPR